MLRHHLIDRICCIVLAAVLLLTCGLMSAVSLGFVEGDSSIGYEDRLFDQERVHTIDIVMDDWEGFLETCTDEQYAACDVVIDGEHYGNVGIRAKGNTSLSSVRQYGNDRYSFKIEFDHYQNGKTYHGLDKLSLNNMIQDKTYLKDYLAYTLMNRMDAASPLCSFVQINVNGEPWGLYLAVEAVEDSFLLRNYGADHGELYKPDSLSFGGGGPGNGKDFSMDDFRERFNTEAGQDTEASFGDGFTMPDMGSFDFGSMPDMSSFDPSSMPDMGSSNSGSMPDMSSFDPSSMPDMGSFDFGSMPDVSSFDPSSMPDMGSFDFGSMPDMGSSNSGSMPDMGSFDFGSMPDVSSFDPNSMPDMGSFDFGSTPDMGSSNSGSMPAMGSSNSGSMPAMGSSDSGSMPDMGSFDFGSMPDMGSFDFGSMPDVSSFDPSSMPDMGSFDFGSMPEMSAQPAEAAESTESSQSSRSRGGFDIFGGGMGSSDVRLQYSGDDPASYSNIFNSAKTEITKSDQQRLIASLKALSEGTDIESVVDVEAVIRYLAVHNFMCNDDSYTGMMVHNYYLYEEDGRMSMLPWDYNLALGGFSMGGFGSSGATSTVNSPIDSPVSMGDVSSRPMVAWIFQNEEYTELYHQIYDEFISTVFESGWFAEEIERVGTMIAPYVQNDVNGFFSYEEFQTALAALKEFCALRAESIRGQLDGTVPSTTAEQRTQSSALIDASHIDLSDMGEFGMGGGGNAFPGMPGSSGSRDGSSAKGSSDGAGAPEGMNSTNPFAAMTPPSNEPSAEASQQQQPVSSATQKPDSASVQNNDRSGAPSRGQRGSSAMQMPDDFTFTGMGSSWQNAQSSTQTLLLLAASVAVLAGAILIALRYRSGR